MSCDVTEEACSGVVAVVVFKLRAVRLGSTVQESWLWIWLHVWCVIGNWLEMAHIEGNSWVVVLVCEPCQVGHVDCWLWSHVISHQDQSVLSLHDAQQLPRYLPPWRPPLLPTSNIFSMPPCRHTTTKPRTNFSTILLPLSYSPATHPMPSSPSSKT